MAFKKKAQHGTGKEARRGETGAENPNDLVGPELRNQPKTMPKVGLLIVGLLGFTPRVWMLLCG